MYDLYDVRTARRSNARDVGIAYDPALVSSSARGAPSTVACEGLSWLNLCFWRLAKVLVWILRAYVRRSSLQLLRRAVRD